MQQNVSAAILALSASCAGTAPTRPVLDPCILDVPNQIGHCQLSDQSEPVRHEPIEYLHKATCLTPKEWEKSENYRQALEAYVKELEGRKCEAR